MSDEYILEIGSIGLVGILLYGHYRLIVWLAKKDCDELGIK